MIKLREKISFFLNSKKIKIKKIKTRCDIKTHGNPLHYLIKIQT
jgi:hypothetical protein